jgi:cytochrome P450
MKKWHRIVEESSSKGYAVMDNPRVEMGRLTLDVVTFLACGSDLNCIETLDSGDSSKREIATLPANLSAFFQRLSEAAIPSLSNKLRDLIPALNKDYIKARDIVLAFIRNMIQQTRQEVEDERAGKITSSGRSNLLKEMIQASIDDDYFTDDELVGEVLTGANWPISPCQDFKITNLVFLDHSNACGIGYN